MSLFDKLISNLPFNPSLIDQVSFYGKRLRQESGIRRLGFAFIAMTMAVQIFATISPAQAGVSCDPSGNDIVQCGFKSKAEAVSRCNGGGKQDTEFRIILLNYGITCDMLSNSTEKSVSSTAYGNQLISVGRKAYQKSGEYSVNINGVGNLFWRPLSSWGSFNSRMLVTQTNDGQLVMVMFECGNLVTLKDFKLKQPQPDSDLKILKSNSPAGEVRSGDTIDYTLAFTNKGGPAAFFNVYDILPNNVSLVSTSQGNWNFENKAPTLRWDNNAPPFYVFGNTDAFGTPGFIFVKVRVNDRVPSGTTLCNTAYLIDVPKGGTGTRKSGETQVCNTVVVTCPGNQILKEDRITCEEVPVPDAVCVSLSATPVTNDKTNKKYLFKSKAAVVNGAKVSSYSYDLGEGTKKMNDSDKLENTLEHEFKTPKTYDVSVTVASSVGDKAALTCRTKVVINPPDETPTKSIKKAAANITQKQSDANGQTANAGDVIEYTLTTSNISSVDDKDTTLLTEDLGDVLEYATLDLTTLQGGTFDAKTQILAWNEKVTIKAKESITKKFRVTVKNPIPSTPRPDTANNRTSGDLLMHNWYGNPVDIKLPTTPIKTTETINTTLPKTGPGESLLVGFLVMSIVGYFFARSRLLAKELEIVKNEYTATGGEI